MTRGFSPGQIIMGRGDGIDEGCGLGARDLVLDLDLGASKAEEEYSIALPKNWYYLRTMYYALTHSLEGTYGSTNSFPRAQSDDISRGQHRIVPRSTTS